MEATIKKLKKEIEQRVIDTRAGACKGCGHCAKLVFKIGNCLKVTADNVSVKVMCRAVGNNGGGVIRTPKDISSNEECLHFMRFLRRGQTR